MDFTDIFRIVNLGVGVAMILGGISQFFYFGIQTLIIGIYCIIFGLATGGLEFQIPPLASKYASFMFSFAGRGAFYLFIGSIICGDNPFKWIIGVVIAAVGCVYVAMEFVPSIEPPANMREAEAASWGAEQI